MKQLHAGLGIFQVIVYAVGFLFSCSPIPAIQSARVTGSAGFATYISSDPGNIRVYTKHSYSYPAPHVESSVNEYLEHTLLRNYFRFGIMDRVEISAFFMLNHYPPGIITCGNCKVALFDVGADRLFQNISAALFTGGDFLPLEHDIYQNFWTGFILGTHRSTLKGDIELVFMGSGSRYHYESREFLLHTASYKTANYSIGCIYRPSRKSFMELNAGATYRIPFDKYFWLDTDYYSSVVEARMDRFTVEPFILQCGIMAYIPRRKPAER